MGGESTSDMSCKSESSEYTYIILPQSILLWRK